MPARNVGGGSPSGGDLGRCWAVAAGPEARRVCGMSGFLMMAAAAVVAAQVATGPVPPKAGTGTTNAAGGLDPATGFSVQAGGLDPVEQGYRALLAKDDAAQEEMDRWIQEADRKGSDADSAGLGRRIEDRIAEVERAYREFLAQNPKHVAARIAYGSFLEDVGREESARQEWEKALALDPSNAAVHNNLAGVYAHRGPVTNAFVHYEKAIELKPDEAVYYHNFGTVVFLYRTDVKAHYGLTNEQAVFDKALGLYARAMRLQPANFILASDVAQTYYGIQPPRHEEALAAWKRAYDLAGDDLERQGVRVHLARIQVEMGRLEEARANLNAVTNAHYAEVTGRIRRKLERKEQERPAESKPTP